MLQKSAKDARTRTLVIAAFFQDIPSDLEAAAMIDGCSRVGAPFRVVIPLSAAGVFTTAIRAFVNAWGEFLPALTLMNRVSMQPLSSSDFRAGFTETLPACVAVEFRAHWFNFASRTAIARLGAPSS